MTDTFKVEAVAADCAGHSAESATACSVSCMDSLRAVRMDTCYDIGAVGLTGDESRIMEEVRL
jgi:hypothetical protein